ncbi:MAG: glycosyltransferase family 4 protein [Flavobacteriaceae bacterium]|jgi:glycosyltransferase involved in cell wall biosynthesis|nr:glycosyltransferase family 4 protein [Flavobacteriaceae bacterium]
MNYPKLIRITTVPLSLKILLKGQLKFMSDFFDVVAVSSPGEDLEIVKKVESVRVEAIEMTRQITPIKDLISLFRLYLFLRKEKPQIVHTHTPKAGTIGILAAKLAGVPHRLHTVAGLPLLETKGKKRKLLNAVEKMTYASATKVYPNSQGLYEIILENGFTTADKLKVIGKGSSNGIDTSFFDPNQISDEEKIKRKQSLNLDENDFVFVFVGRLVGDKGMNELVSAFSELSKLNLKKTPKLVLVGPLEEELDPLLPETMKKIQSHPQIQSLGFQEDVRPYFAISDCLVFPSYREGFPNVVMQAGAMGLPAIVSNINGCNEIISDGKNGRIVPPKNRESLLEAMKEIIENPQKRNQWAEISRNQILENYERTYIWNELLSEYKSLLGN